VQLLRLRARACGRKWSSSRIRLTTCERGDNRRMLNTYKKRLTIETQPSIDRGSRWKVHVLDAVLRGERVEGDSQVVKRCSFGRKPHAILRRVREWNRHNVAQLPAEVVQTARRRRHGQNGPILGGGGACCLLKRRSWSQEGSSG
jgi:hypothetical protein